MYIVAEFTSVHKLNYYLNENDINSKGIISITVDNGNWYLIYKEVSC